MDEKRSLAVPVPIAVLLLLPCLYAGSYLALMKPQGKIVVLGRA